MYARNLKETKMQNDEASDLKAEINRLKGVISEFGIGEGEAFRAATVAACDERIAAYKLEAREAKKLAGEGQPIDTAPKDGTHILLYGEEYFWVGFCYEDDSEWSVVTTHPISEDADVSPTHWWPLPEVPSEN
jgi:hypothetical protein